MTQNWVEKIENLHISVLLQELVENAKFFKDRKNIVVDCTLWLAWHASKIIELLNPGDIFVWFDADKDNLALAKKRLEGIRDDIEIKLINSNFLYIKEELEKVGINEITYVYYDLWLSSVHFDDASKGFSFRETGPLDMRLDRTSKLKAYDVVNYYSLNDLIKIFREYWEENMSTRIAKSIVEARLLKTIDTTTDLAEIINKISFQPQVKARIFQAIRIEVNKELENLEKSLSDAIELLVNWWRIFAISFHSLEDRIVKQTLKREERDCICSDIICTCHHIKSLKNLYKKPILPTEEEQKANSRSRSAKARVAEKII